MYIYFIQQSSNGPIKIGITKHFKSRLKSIQSCNPYEISVLALIEGTYQDESKIHRNFKDVRLHGEWFKPTKELVEYCNTLGMCKVKPVFDNQHSIPVGEVLRMREEGLTYAKIGEHFQVSRQYIHQIVKNNT